MHGGNGVSWMVSVNEHRKHILQVCFSLWILSLYMHAWTNKWMDKAMTQRQDHS